MIIKDIAIIIADQWVKLDFRPHTGLLDCYNMTNIAYSISVTAKYYDIDIQVCDMRFSNDCIVVYTWDTSIPTYTSYEYKYEDLTDIDEFIGTIICRRFYNN